jgi:steroid delta-isomerase-like uncharacterized protein
VPVCPRSGGVAAKTCPRPSRSGEQEGFGAATPGQAQAENSRLDPEMIDEGRNGGLSPEDLIREMFATVFNAGDLDAVDRLIAPHHRNHDPTAPPAPTGPQGVRQLAREYREAFPDLHMEIEEIFSSEERVAHRWTMSGTHEGEIMEIAPTGRRIEIAGIEINRIERGKIAESWAISDSAGLRQQLQG